MKKTLCLFADCTLKEKEKICLCMPGYKWSEDMCKNHGCCNNSCTLNLNDIAVCLPETRGRVLFDMGTGFHHKNK